MTRTALIALTLCLGAPLLSACTTTDGIPDHRIRELCGQIDTRDLPQCTGHMQVEPGKP